MGDRCRALDNQQAPPQRLQQSYSRQNVAAGGHGPPGLPGLGCGNVCATAIGDSDNNNKSPAVFMFRRPFRFDRSML